MWRLNNKDKEEESNHKEKEVSEKRATLSSVLFGS